MRLFVVRASLHDASHIYTAVDIAITTITTVIVVSGFGAIASDRCQHQHQ